MPLLLPLPMRLRSQLRLSLPLLPRLPCGRKARHGHGSRQRQGRGQERG